LSTPFQNFSDVDVVVTGVSSDKSSFRRLEAALRETRSTSYLEAILNARVCDSRISIE
jgi:hypothetical protein